MAISLLPFPHSKSCSHIQPQIPLFLPWWCPSFKPLPDSPLSPRGSSEEPSFLSNPLICPLPEAVHVHVGAGTCFSPSSSSAWGTQSSCPAPLPSSDLQHHPLFGNWQANIDLQHPVKHLFAGGKSEFVVHLEMGTHFWAAVPSRQPKHRVYQIQNSQQQKEFASGSTVHTLPVLGIFSFIHKLQ